MDLRHGQNAVVGRAVNEAVTATHARFRVAQAANHGGSVAPLPDFDAMASAVAGTRVVVLRAGVQALGDAVLGP